MLKIDRKIWFGSGLLVLILIGAFVVQNWLRTPSGSPALQPENSKIVSRGAAIYATSCAACHGRKLEGQPNWRSRLPNGRLPAPPHDETGHTWHHADKLLFKLTKPGPAGLVGGNYSSDMPAYAGTLTDDEIIAVLSYIKSTWPLSIRQRHDKLSERQK